MSRIIGITHRVKRTKEGEARPTLISILDENGQSEEYKLDTETDELDFVFAQFPTKYRGVIDGEALEKFMARQLKRRKDKTTGKEVVDKVPIEFDGLKADDTVAMSLGGSGDYLAHALFRQAKKVGAKIVRLTPARLKNERGETSKKDEDPQLMAKLARDKPELFEPMLASDLPIIEVRIAFRDRSDAMKDRIACEQRLFQRLIGREFVTAGEAPERSLEEAFLAAKADDVIYQALQTEEKRREVELIKRVRSMPVWQEVLLAVEGCGEMISARLIAAIGDIRRFASDTKLKSFCGTRPTKDGKFLRRRSGEVANWHPDARQALYLLGDQMNRRPASVWGQRLREYKVKLRATHPEVVMRENGAGKLVKCYTDGHIHKMATWRTLSKFVEWLWREWWRLEGGQTVQAKEPSAKVV